MKILKKESFVGKLFIFLGIIFFTLGIVGMSFYVFPILFKHRLGESNNMNNAFKDLTLFRTGASDFTFALAGGITSILVGIILIVWGTLMIFFWRVTFISKNVLVFTGVISAISLGAIAPSAIAIKKGTSDEIKIIHDFNEVDDYFSNVYTEMYGSMSGIVYTSVISDVNITLHDIQDKKWNAATTVIEKSKIFELEVDFDPIAALKTGKIRDGLKYFHNIWSGDKTGVIFKGIWEIYKNPFSKILIPKDEVALIDEVFMGYVDAVWTGLSILSKQSVSPKNWVDNNPGTLTGDEGIAGTANTKDFMEDAIKNAIKKLKGVDTQIDPTEEEKEGWKEHLELLRDVNDLMFKTLMGSEDKAQESMNYYDKEATAIIGGKSTLEYQLGYANIIVKIQHHLTRKNILDQTNLSAQYIKDKSEQESIKLIENLFKIINKPNTVSAADKKNDARSLIAKVLGIKIIPQDIIGNKPKNKKLDEVIEQLLIYHGIFKRKHNSLMYKLNQFRIENGKEAASENLYLYLARIGEMSSDHYYLSQEEGESGSGKLTSANKKQYMFDYAFNTAGRVSSRALLFASLKAASSNSGFINNIIKGSHMEQSFKDHIFGSNLNVEEKMNYDLRTKTSDYESLYKEFISR
ncbi:MAG: hypothetical protein KAG14_00845 [Mycoplasmataceae bacterium]|nr:hypothetical protein [Mycoplasmataceae bacterium]